MILKISTYAHFNNITLLKLNYVKSIKIEKKIYALKILSL